MRRKWLLLAMLPAACGHAQTVDDFLGDEAVHEIRLRVNPADWSKLRANYLDNTYYECQFEWRGMKLEGVGIRSRAKGSRSPVKPSLRIDFDRFEPEQKFLGLKSVVLKNNAQDASMLKERLSMALFTRMGLPAPREAHARVYVNDSYAGLYLIVEPIDRRYVKQWFDDDDGYLYQYGSGDPYQFEYRGPDPARYIPVPFKPETHESDPKPEPLIDLIRVLNEATDEEFLRRIGKRLDLGMYVRQLAVENFLAEFDGLLAMNNFFLYRKADEALFRPLVWDKDGVFSWGARSIWLFVENNVLARRALANPELRALFLETVARAAVLAGDSGGWFEQEIERQYQQIRTAAREDSKKQCNPGPKTCSNDEFEAGVAEVRRFAWERVPFVRDEIAADGFQLRRLSPRLDWGGVFTYGALVTLNGERLGDKAESTEVYVNGFRAAVMAAGPDAVTFELPRQIGPGWWPVTAVVNGVLGNTIWIESAAE